MSMTMDQDKIKALALELAKDIKTPENLSALSVQLTKIAVESAPGAEMGAHLGYSPNEISGKKAKTAILQRPLKVITVKSSLTRLVIVTVALNPLS